jgi:prepilin-type N-terminal cleavage/methylation domain-containing protein
MSTRPCGARSGFTLTEILVAAGLIGVVMAMAMQAFMGLTRISETTRSQIVAQSEASKGVHAVAALLRRAHVVYFTGRPLANVTNFPAARRADQLVSNPAPPNNFNDLEGVPNVDPDTLPIPSVLGQAGPPAFQSGTTFYNFNAATPDFRLTDAGLQQYRVSKFRFWDALGANGDTLTLGDRLRTMDPTAARAYDRYFPSPLMYIAEAELATDRNNVGAQDGTVANMFMPLSWTFHIVYLAPMNIQDPARAPAWIARARDVPKDRAAAGWNRSTIPFELRALTIPAVQVDLDADGDRTRAQRLLADGTVPKPPFDYLMNQINYHPVPINWENNPLITPKASTFAAVPANRRRLEPAPAGLVDAAGARVAGAGAVPHANYNNIGNDPPTNEVLQLRFGNARPRDVVLASYVDPDSVHGTCVRLLNTLGQAPHSAADGETVHPVPPAMGVYRKYLNAYGGEFLYNHYAALTPNPAAWDVTRGSSIPRRALVSVSTRYRTDSRIKFLFATETVEIDLENVVRFQTLNGSMNL